jgi:hypothetical protein
MRRGFSSLPISHSSTNLSTSNKQGASEGAPEGVSRPNYLEREYTVGVDLGQRVDYTAMVVLKKTIAPPDTALFSPVGRHPGNRLVDGGVYFDVVYAKRVKDRKLSAIARELVDKVGRLAPLGEFGERGKVSVAIDGTGLGRTVIDIFEEEIGARGRRGYFPKVDFRPVNWRSSNESMKRPQKEGDYYNVPWADVVNPAVVAFPEGIIRIGKVDDKDQLLHELKTFRNKKPKNPGGAEKYEAWREKDHDDILAALTLAYWCWWFKRKGSQVLRVIR